MSALTILLGPAPQEIAGRDMPHARTLQLPSGEQLHFQEDESTEGIIIFSLPGVVRDASWLAGREQPWRSELKHAEYDDVQCVLAIAPDSGQVYLIDMCDRTAVYPGMLEEFLADHMARHHECRRLLTHDGARDSADAAGYGAPDGVGAWPGFALHPFDRP